MLRGSPIHTVVSRSISLGTLILTLASPCLGGGGTFTVTKTADTADGTCDADCSLREAIIAANAGLGGTDLIVFDIPEGSCSAAGVCEILVASSLPSIIESVNIDGTSQARYGTAPENVCATSTAPSFMRIQITGDGSQDIFDIQSTGPTTIRGISILGANYGVQITSTGAGFGEHRIQCNHLGVNAEGSGITPATSTALYVSSGEDGATLVGTDGDGVEDLAERNLLAGSYSVNINTGVGTTVAGNYICLTADGLTRLPCNLGSIGVYIRQDASNSRIGSDLNALSDDLEANYFGGFGTAISLNTRDTASGLVVAGNRIGVNVRGQRQPTLTGLLIAGDTQDLLFKNNLVHGSQVAGVKATGAATLAAGSAGNCIQGNEIGFDNGGTNAIGFADNWWGDPSGPSGDESGSGDSVISTNTGVLTVSPWLASAPASCKVDPIFADGFESDSTGAWLASLGVDPGVRDWVAVGSSPQWADSSVDNGNTWAASTAPPTSPYTLTVYDVTTNGAGNWVAVGADWPYIWRSIDNGAHWTGSPNGPLGLSSIYLYGVATDRVGSWVAVGSGGAETWRSTDNGINWIPATTTTGAQQAVATDGAGNWVAVGFTSPYASRSTDGGDTWTTATTGPNGLALAVATDGLGHWAAVGLTGALAWLSNDNGDTWTAATTTIGGSAGLAVATDGAGNWVAGGNGGIWRSTDNGDHWIAATSVPADMTVEDVATDGLGNWVAVGSSPGGVTAAISTDNGDNWTEATTLPAGTRRGVAVERPLP